MSIFQDRADAGQQLAERLLSLELSQPTILAIPRGGILVGVPIARAFGVGLGVVITRRLTCPRYPELGFGALGEDNIQVLDPSSMDLLNITPEELRVAQAQAQPEIQQRRLLFRRGQPLPNLSGQSVVIVDDGLATGLSAKAAIRVVQSHAAAQIIVAAPVASSTTVHKLGAEAEIICLVERRDFRCVAEWYQDFNPNLTDAEVLAALTSK